MTRDTWNSMTELEEAFSQISTFNFLLAELQDAVDKSDMIAIVNASHALNAFLPVYTRNWDNKFKVAWAKTVALDKTDLFE